MKSLAELKNETTLSTIAQNPEANLHYLLFAIVIDVSEPTKQENSSNYLTRLKIIDPSFNYKAEVKTDRLKFHKFVHINIFSETPEDCPRIQFVGDIIRLRRFRFKYTKNGELMGNEMKYSNWLVYSGKKGDSPESNSYKNFSKNIGRKLTKNEEGRLADLREWSETFFYKNSMKYIGWWNDWNRPSDDKAKVAGAHENVDLVLKCLSVEGAKKSKVSFADKDGVVFDLHMNEKASLKPGQIIKLRCVEIAALKGKEASRVIKLTKLSSCLLLPSLCCDNRQFEKAAADKKSPAKSGKAENLPFLGDYAVEEAEKGSKSTPKKGAKANAEKWVTAVKKTLANKKVTSVAQLLEHQANFQSFHGQVFLLKGYIAGFVNTDPHAIIKRLNLDDKKISDFQLDAKEKKYKKIKIIYHLVMHVKDDSVGKSDQFLDVYVLTGEYESHLFSAWGILPPNDDITQWNKIKDSKLAEFEKRLKALKNPENKVRMALELMVTKQGKAFYRLVDTVFLP